MKTKSILMGVALMASLMFGCKKDEPKEDISWAYGKWEVTDVKTKESDKYSNWLSQEWYARFDSNGSYSSRSPQFYSGTYTVKGNDITCKVGSETVVYNILSRSGNLAEARMYYGSSPNVFVWFKLKRQ
ncbi:MAG: hypothetical protein EAZ51_01600 [Sphingobacteriales bacterium]|nr:MAG: hypothetical protein EAZ51_01600 [Sphingobacteriales bacterium]